jgi:hypothetical protein
MGDPKIIIKKNGFESQMEISSDKIYFKFELPVNEEGFILEEYSFILDHFLKLIKDEQHEVEVMNKENLKSFTAKKEFDRVETLTEEPEQGSD